jgi:hypothetical protein
MILYKIIHVLLHPVNDKLWDFIKFVSDGAKC